MDRSRLVLVGCGVSGDVQVYGPANYATPLSEAGRTPMYACSDKTPVYGGQSPGGLSVSFATSESGRTPMYADGNKTPVCGGQSPGGVVGNKTPMYSGQSPGGASRDKTPMNGSHSPEDLMP